MVDGDYRVSLSPSDLSGNVGASSFSFTIEGGLADPDWIVSKYTMDNIQENILVDERGRFNGTIVDATQTMGSGGVKGEALEFGEDRYVSFPKDVISGDEFGISFFEHSLDGDYPGDGYLVCDSEEVMNLFFRRFFETGTSYSGVVGDLNFGHDQLEQKTYPKGDFNFIVINKYRDGRIEVFVNDMINPEAVGSGSNFSGLKSNLYLGNRYDLQRDYMGRIDQVTIAARPFGESERKGLQFEVLEFSEMGEVSILGTGVELTDYQVRVNIPYAPQMKSDYSDLRFTDSEGNLLSFYLDTFDTQKAVLWVKVPSIPAEGVSIYLYYGAPEAKSVSDGASTFDLFLDFEDGDLSGWTNDSGALSIDGNLAKEGSNSLKWDRTISTNISERFTNDPVEQQDLVLDWYALAKKKSGDDFHLTTLLPFGKTQVNFSRETDGNMYLGWGNSGYVFPLNEWHKFEVLLKPSDGMSDYKVFNSNGDLVAYRSDVPISPYSTTQTTVQIGQDAWRLEHSDYRFDRIRIRRHTVVEPVAGLK
jgi:hypothetical protein